MDVHQHHEELISEITQEFGEILDNSTQGIYIYLDDVHKVCNEKYASMLGFSDPKEWQDIPEDIVGQTVVDESQETLVNAYRNAMENFEGSNIKIAWKNKKGEEIKTDVIIVPISFKGHYFALHFVSI